MTLKGGWEMRNGKRSECDLAALSQQLANLKSGRQTEKTSGGEEGEELALSIMRSRPYYLGVRGGSC